MSGFGWNFYGFFVMAAVWVAIYFVWAWWMEGRDTKRTRNEHRTHTAVTEK